MADFNRIVSPNKVFYPSMTPGNDSWGHSGKPQFRNINQAGREWKEEYPPMRASLASTRKFLAYINNLWRNRIEFTIAHKHLGTPANAPITGSLVMNGANQTGSTISVTASLSQPLLYGDIIKIAGINVVVDVIEDMTSGSDTTIVINPPLIVGMAHANGAVITYNSVKFNCVLDEGLEFPVSAVDGVYEDLVLKFRESP